MLGFRSTTDQTGSFDDRISHTPVAHDSIVNTTGHAPVGFALSAEDPD
jgi:hypothetical protein